MSKLVNLIRKAGTVRGLQFFQLMRLAGIILTGILFTKSQFTIREIGIYESLMYASTIFSFFWVNGLLHSLLSTYSKKESGGGESRIFNTSVIIILLNAVLVAMLWVFKPLVIKFLPQEASSYFPILLIYILLNNPAFLVEYLLLLREKPRSLIIYGILMFIFHLVLVAGPALAGLPFIQCLYGLLAIAVLKNLYLVKLLIHQSVPRMEVGRWSEIIFTASPLVLSFLISGSSDYIDGFLVSTHFGSDAFALYRYGARELPLAVLLASSITGAMIPVLSTPGRLVEGLNTIKTESVRLMHWVFPVSMLLMLGSSYIYPFIFRREFIESAGIFNIYLLLIISRVLFPQALVLAHGRNDVIFKVAIAEILINIAASYFLMLEFGMYGVAWGTVLAFYSEKIILYLFMKKAYGIKLSQLLSVRIWITYSTLLIITYLIYFFIILPNSSVH